MKPKALFIGSIGAAAETSELQRQAYNQSLRENGVNWEWSKDTYRDLLQSSGGIHRLETLSAATGQDLSDETIRNIHRRKTEIAGELIKEHQVKPRAGLKKLIDQAKRHGAKVAWVTTTGEENTNAILSAFDGEVEASDFDRIFHRDDAEDGKPAPAIYHTAMEHFDVQPEECVAVEDSVNSVLSAKGASIYTIATPGENHNENMENIADLVIPSLDKVDWEQISIEFSTKRESATLAE